MKLNVSLKCTMDSFFYGRVSEYEYFSEVAARFVADACEFVYEVSRDMYLNGTT